MTKQKLITNSKFKTMLSLFNKPAKVTIDPIQDLQKKSEMAINVFVKTREDLTMANEGIQSQIAKEKEALAAEQARLEAIIAEAQGRVDTLAVLETGNQNFIEKINNLFT